MLKKILFLLLLMGCMLHAADYSSFTFAKGSDKYYADGKMESCKLKQPALINGYLCKNKVYFHANGNLKQCELAEQVVIKEEVIAKHTTLQFSEDGKISKKIKRSFWQMLWQIIF